MVTKRESSDPRVGLSTDIKPTNVNNGTRFIEMDTSSIYLYDAQNKKWFKQTCCQCNGGSSSDLSDILICSMDSETALLNHTWQEINSAKQVGLLITDPNGNEVLGTMTSITPYTVSFVVPYNGEEITIKYIANDEDDYPIIEEAYEPPETWEIKIEAGQQMRTEDSDQGVIVSTRLRSGSTVDQYVFIVEANDQSYTILKNNSTTITIDKPTNKTLYIVDKYWRAPTEITGNAETVFYEPGQKYAVKVTGDCTIQFEPRYLTDSGGNA